MTKEQWLEIKHFRPHEFDCPTSPGSGEKMDYDFVKKLDKIREECGFPFHINSGYRTPEHNRNVGGVDSSAHTHGCAADIQIEDSYKRFLIIGVAFHNGIRRIGVGKTFIHLDSDLHLPDGRIWIYA